jgi:plasmid segregation protein ParM
MSKKIVRALDLGWGFAKYTVEVDGAMEFHSFPSLAPKHTGIDLSGALMGRRDTVVVSVQGSKYEVGPDSSDLDPNDSTRNLSDNYAYTDQYQAVFLGSLHYMQTPVIDLLVLGLPLSHMHLTDHLKKMAKGGHEVGGNLYEVKDVEVLPQPVGGLNYCFSLKGEEGFEDLKDEVNLIIDPGFLTLDFLVSNGDRPVDSRSGAHTGGVSKVLRAMADSISRTYGIKFENLSAIDRALRKNKLKINGQQVAIEPHIMEAKSVVDGSISYVKNIVGSGADIDNILLLGGGSFIYKKTLSQAFPNHKITVVPECQTANVRGYYEAGMKLAK